jgi:5-methylcytosine-specific restriction endonuclease McrA
MRGRKLWNGPRKRISRMPKRVAQAYRRLQEWIDLGHIPPDVLAGRTIGPIMVIEFAGMAEANSIIRKPKRLWKCKCCCGCLTEMIIREEDIISLRSWALGRKKPTCVKSKWQRIIGNAEAQRRWKAKSQECAQKERAKLKVGWSRAMERALAEFQPECVVCGSRNSLVTDHVVAAGLGKGLFPGNVVRLCTSCNMRKWKWRLRQLPAKIATRLRKAADAFGEFWKNLETGKSQTHVLISTRIRGRET